MKAYIYFFKYSIIILVFVLLTSSRKSFAQGFSPDVQNRFETIIDSFQNNPNNPFIGGMSVAIKVDDLALWQGATGYAARNIDDQNNLLPGGTSFSTDTLSRIYSVTKTFTAALTLELAKRKVFNLDEPIIKYLPLLSTANPGLNTTVTIRQLLAHESGYSDYTDEQDLQIAVAFSPTHIWTPYEMVSYVHQIAAPGAERKYSSTNYVLLGAIIEAATGKPVEELFRKGFFNRLSLSSMYFGGRESVGNRGNLASPHDNISAFNPIFEATGQPTFPDAYTNISRFPLDGIVSLAFTGGAIVSNAADLAEWSNDLYGGKATSKSTIDTMLNSISSTPDEDGDRLGYGIILSNKISGKYDFIGHDGNAPGYRAIMFYQPEKKMTIVVLTNFHGADPYAIAKALYAATPSFVCFDNKNIIKLCFKNKTICVPAVAAKEFIKKGAYLGGCGQPVSQPIASSSNALKISLAKNNLSVSPNPVTSHSTISFQTEQSGNINLSLYDVNGKLVATLFNGNAEKGIQRTAIIEAGKLNSGIYICRLQTSTGAISQKIILQR
ncbi:MAG TPA: serine hydrolase [Parafilimonas sp.]|nr:serine hydrolase [Parafilimonas sp.]